MSGAKLESRIREFFDADERQVAAVYLFGSCARGKTTPRSDVDIAILLLAEPPSTLEGLCLNIGADLERILGVEVDLVVLNKAPVDLIHRILRDGRLLVDRNPSARIAFEVKARNEYFDLQPVLVQYRKARETKP